MNLERKKSEIGKGSTKKSQKSTNSIAECIHPDELLWAIHVL
jgi:hypothetical protein